MSNKPQKQATVNEFWVILSPQYLPELLVDVYSYCLMVKIVYSCCVNGTSFLFLCGLSNSNLLPQNYFNRHCFYLIYFICTPLHELHFTLSFIQYAFPSYLNHGFTYFNHISATIYLMYPLQVKEFTS